MKIASNRFIILTVLVIGWFSVIAGNNPPQPNPMGKNNAAMDDSFPPPPPGLPVDENIFVLFSVAILLGTFIIYKNNLKAKNPI
ncbi:hypothetical protein [Flavobacterium sp. W22_SRS_FP1]|uniref:hypothetical protein n=1 Tax=Flavobacterium sp. W22_SRS_FP1 TaxID=3240276 RepID=UPI003F90000E